MGVMADFRPAPCSRAGRRRAQGAAAQLGVMRQVPWKPGAHVSLLTANNVHVLVRLATRSDA